MQDLKLSRIDECSKVKRNGSFQVMFLLRSYSTWAGGTNIRDILPSLRLEVNV